MVNPNTIRYLNQYVNSSLLTTGGLITENKMARAMKLLLRWYAVNVILLLMYAANIGGEQKLTFYQGLLHFICRK
jgi:hypothetical protein